MVRLIFDAPSLRRSEPAPRPTPIFDAQPKRLGLRNDLPKDDTSRATGTVKWFNGTKGDGFIQPDDGGADIFVHISAVERAGLRSLNEGQKITYELEQDRRSGKMAAGNLQV